MAEQQNGVQVADQVDVGSTLEFTVGGESFPTTIDSQSSAVSLLVDRRKFTEEQSGQVAAFVNAFDMDNTADILEFASEPQREVSGHLDLLLEGVVTKDVGAAGDLAMALADGIDLMQLEKVKGMLKAGEPGWFSKLMMMIGLWTNYIKAYHESQDPIIEKFAQMETTARNKQANVRGEIQKLDSLVDASIKQIGLLELFIVAGEDILAREVARYQKEAKEAYDNKDGLKASEVRDLRNRIVQFDVRLLRCKQALVQAQAKTIPEIRSAQEAMVIEIQNLEEGILFEVPKLKTLVVQLNSYIATKDAQKGRQAMDDVSKRLDAMGSDLHEEIVVAAKESQGHALERAERLDASIAALEELIRKTEAMEKENAEKRRRAGELLTATRDRMMDTINNVNMEAAEAATA